MSFSFINHPVTQIYVISILTASLNRIDSSRLGFQTTCFYIPENSTLAVLFNEYSRHKLLESIQKYYSPFTENRNFVSAPT
jgi:hypothetical protein